MLSCMTLLHQRNFSGRLELFGNISLLSDNIAQASQNALYNFISDNIFRGSISESLATLSCHRRGYQSWHKISAAMEHFKYVASGTSRRDGELEDCYSCCPRWETQLVLLAASSALPGVYCDCPNPFSATNLALWGSAGQNSQCSQDHFAFSRRLISLNCCLL